MELLIHQRGFMTLAGAICSVSVGRASESVHGPEVSLKSCGVALQLAGREGQREDWRGSGGGGGEVR